MSSRRATLAAVAALVAVGAGCGNDTNAPTTDAARTQAEQVVESLSPQARDLLRDAEALAGRTSAAARGYAEGDLAPARASAGP